MLQMLTQCQHSKDNRKLSTCICVYWQCKGHKSNITKRSKRSQCKQQNPKSVTDSKRRRGWVWTWLVATPRVGLMSRDSPHKAFALCDITTHWALSCPKLWLCIASATLTLALCFQSFCGLGTHTSNTDAALAGMFAREKAIKEDRSTH